MIMYINDFWISAGIVKLIVDAFWNAKKHLTRTTIAAYSKNKIGQLNQVDTQMFCSRGYKNTVSYLAHAYHLI